MRVGETITIQRLPSGFYAIQRSGQPTLVGGAASTAIALAHVVFQEEAHEGREYIMAPIGAGGAETLNVPIQVVRR